MERFINKQRLYILLTLVECENMTEIKIPLILKLKRAQQKEIAKAQDIIVNTLYEVFENAVLHGGTSIWRCYNGNRFSEDVDVYIVKDNIEIPSNLVTPQSGISNRHSRTKGDAINGNVYKKIDLFFDKLKEKGFIELKKKVSLRIGFSVCPARIKAFSSSCNRRLYKIVDVIRSIDVF